MGRASVSLSGIVSVRDRVASYKRVQDEKQGFVQVSVSRKRPSKSLFQPDYVRDRVQQFLISKRGTPRRSRLNFADAPLSWRSHRFRMSTAVTRNVFDPWQNVAAAPPSSFNFALPTVAEGKTPQWMVEVRRRARGDRGPSRSPSPPKGTDPMWGDDEQQLQPTGGADSDVMPAQGRGGVPEMKSLPLHMIPARCV